MTPQGVYLALVISVVVIHAGFALAYLIARLVSRNSRNWKEKLSPISVLGMFVVATVLSSNHLVALLVSISDLQQVIRILVLCEVPLVMFWSIALHHLLTNGTTTLDAWLICLVESVPCLIVVVPMWSGNHSDAAVIATVLLGYVGFLVSGVFLLGRIWRQTLSTREAYANGDSMHFKLARPIVIFLRACIGFFVTCMVLLIPALLLALFAMAFCRFPCSAWSSQVFLVAQVPVTISSIGLHACALWIFWPSRYSYEAVGAREVELV